MFSIKCNSQLVIIRIKVIRRLFTYILQNLMLTLLPFNVANLVITASISRFLALNRSPAEGGGDSSSSNAAAVACRAFDYMNDWLYNHVCTTLWTMNEWRKYSLTPLTPFNLPNYCHGNYRRVGHPPPPNKKSQRIWTNWKSDPRSLAPWSNCSTSLHGATPLGISLRSYPFLACEFWLANGVRRNLRKVRRNLRRDSFIRKRSQTSCEDF